MHIYVKIKAKRREKQLTDLGHGGRGLGRARADQDAQIAGVQQRRPWGGAVDRDA